MRIVGRGHPAIRATHHKTLELTRDTDITERATCIVAVGVAEAWTPMAGDVRITITTAGTSFSFAARANSSWNPAGTAIIRRSPFRLPDTFATHASAAAHDLPRELAGAMRDPDVVVETAIERVGGRRCAVLFAVDPSTRPDDPRLRAELAAADLVIAEDEDAARLVGQRVAHGPVAIDGRVLVLAARDLPGAGVVDALPDADVETVGLQPALSAAAASPSRAPLVLATTDPRTVLRTAAAANRVVIGAAAKDVAALLAFAADQRGTGEAVLVQGSAPPIRIRHGEPFELSSNDRVQLCFPAATAGNALDPRVRRAIEGLLADGVSTRVAARTLAELTGWPRRRAYEHLLGDRSD